MIEVDGRTPPSLFGLLGVFLGAGSILDGVTGNSNRTFLVIMILLTVLLPSTVRAAEPEIGLRFLPPGTGDL
jgi:hypothetical protein